MYKTGSKETQNAWQSEGNSHKAATVQRKTPLKQAKREERLILCLSHIYLLYSMSRIFVHMVCCDHSELVRSLLSLAPRH